MTRRPAGWFNEPDQLRGRAREYDERAFLSPAAHLAHLWRLKATELRRRAQKIQEARDER
jgi:cytosine/adenosine deaminase-related metal-dependent hydrolase